MVIKERKINCKVHIHTSVPYSFLLEKKIYSEILYNLFQNAVKFNKVNGSILTTISYDSHTGKLLTSIEDTGVGIVQNVKHNLFIAFRG